MVNKILKKDKLEQWAKGITKKVALYAPVLKNNLPIFRRANLTIKLVSWLKLPYPDKSGFTMTERDG